MTFLLVDRELGSRASTLDLECVEQDDLVLGFENEYFKLFSTRPPVAIGAEGRVGLFEGYAFDPSGKLYHSNYQLRSDADAPRLREDVAALEGVFCLVDVDGQKGTVDIQPDKTGNYPVFYFRNGRNWGVCDDLTLLKQVAAEAGEACRPNPLSAAMHTTWGTAFGENTIFKTLSLLQSRHVIRFDSANGLQVNEKYPRQRFLSRYASYDEAIADVKTRLTARCNGILDGIDSSWNRVVDLSGGRDSRMTVSGFLSTGRGDEVDYFTLGQYADSDDRLVADYIIDHFGLAPGRILALNSYKQFSYPAKIAARARRLHGLKSKSFPDGGELRVDKFCRASGYFGEYSKSHGAPIIKGQRPLATAKKTLDSLLVEGIRERSLLRDEGFAAVRDYMLEYYSDLFDEVPSVFVNSFVYFEQKGRFHFGSQSSVTNKYRVSLDPLADSGTISAVLQLEYPYQKKNRVAYDIIRGLGGDWLAMAPFGKPGWPRRWMSSDAPNQPFPKADRADANIGWVEVPGERKLDIRDNPETVRLDLESDARYIAASGAGSVLDQLLIFLAECVPAQDEFWSLFDRDLFTPEGLTRIRLPRFKDNKENLAVLMMLYTGFAEAPRQSGSYSF